MKKVTFAIGMEFDKDGNAIMSHSGLDPIDLAYRRIAQVFGGYSAHEVNGGWITPQGDLVAENALVIEVFVDGSYGDSWKPGMIEDTAQWLADLFNQESVMVAIQEVESLQFVPGKKVAA